MAAILLVACSGNGLAQEPVAETGKVILVKYRALQDMSFVHGAFVIKSATPPARTANGTIVSVVTYAWFLDTPKGRISGEAQVPDNVPIQFGETAASPGVRVSWSYKDTNSGYLRSGILGADHGAYICVTTLEQFPSTELSGMPCEYVEPLPKGYPG
jgi:hypothetical protein